MTERYTLFEIPFFSERLLSLTTFATKEEVNKLLLPFKEKQEEKQKNSGE
jgi:hypothetical protein